MSEGYFNTLNNSMLLKRSGKVMKQVSVRYYKTYSDEYVESSNQDYKLPVNYIWVHKNIVYRLFSFIIYGFACVFGCISRLILHISVKNRRILYSCRSTGYFLYGNHTQPVGDVFVPSQIVFPKRMYAIAGTANLGIPVIGKLLPLMGALPVPETLQGLKKFISAVNYRINENKCVVIYPEAHVWPFCSFLRPFPITSFRFPVITKKPSFCMTTTYQKRKVGKKPKITVYIDGPFWPDASLKQKEQQKKLCSQIYDCMVKRSRNSTYEYIQYKKEPE